MANKTAFILFLNEKTWEDFHVFENQTYMGGPKDAPPPRHLDPKEEPFVVMSADHWNAFQDKLDELGVREEFKRLRGLAVIVNVKNIARSGGELKEALKYKKRT